MTTWKLQLFGMTIVCEYNRVRVRVCDESRTSDPPQRCVSMWPRHENTILLTSTVTGGQNFTHWCGPDLGVNLSSWY